MFNLEGITTGNLAYSWKNEMFQDALPFRTLENYTFDIYSTDISGLSPATIQSNIYNQFTGLYSGDIRVKVFKNDNSFIFPSDNIRESTFSVSVEIRDIPYNLIGYSELSGSQYNGLNSSFFQNYSTALVDFKEDFSFDTNDNGVNSLNHTFSFGLMSGGKPLSQQIASGIFGSDYTLPFGASVFINGITGANTSLVQNYFTESYDLIKQSYSFSKKREFLPSDVGSYNYNLNHSMSMNENGVFDIIEKCDIKAKIDFSQAQQGINTLYSSSQARCSNYYSLFTPILAQPGDTSTTTLISNTPRRTTTTYNKPTLEASYEVVYTNDPQFTNSGYSQEEVIELEVNSNNIVSISDKYTFKYNRRNNLTPMTYNLISGAYNYSLPTMSGYYNTNAFYNSNQPLNLIKYDMNWPYNKSEASVTMYYSNDPRNNVTLNGVFFNTLDYKVTNDMPEDMVSEFKIINRPTKSSVLSFAYQSSVGKVIVNWTAGIGRLPNEFVSGFRTDLEKYLIALYTQSINIFMGQFNKIFATSFTYYLSDMSWALNNDGTLNVVCEFSYTLKRYLQNT